jgi:hypothetical protein
MPFKNTHFSAVWLFCVVIFIIFEEDIVEETFGVIGHLVADNIKSSVSLAEWELLPSEGSANHTDCIAPLTVFICSFRIA